MASSSTGAKVVAAQKGGSIYASTNYGLTWASSDAPPGQWDSLASSADGVNLAAADSGGFIYTSINSGLNWVKRTGAPVTFYNGVASSEHGDQLVAVCAFISHPPCRVSVCRFASGL